MPEIDSHNHPLWDEHSGTDPIMVTAVHSGHALRDELHQVMALDEKTRLCEEDPFTDAWGSISETTSSRNDLASRSTSCSSSRPRCAPLP